MTRPDLRTPRPGELLRAAAASPGTSQARQARPWAAANTASGLRAIDREMIYLDEKAAQSVAEARAEIATVADNLLWTQTAFTQVLHDQNVKIAAAEADITAAEAALTDLEDVQLPALRGRLDDAEYDVKNISAEWITAGTIDTARLNVLDIAAETAQVIDLDVSRLTASAATIDEGVVNKLWSDVVVTRFLTATEKIITEDVIATGAVTAPALNVVSTSGTGHSWRLDETGLIAMHTSSQEAMHIDSGGIRMWDDAGELTVRINGKQNLLQGEFRTSPAGVAAPGVIISNTNEGLPGVWFSTDGAGGYTKAGMWLQDAGTVIIQGTESGGVPAPVNIRGGIRLVSGRIYSGAGYFEITRLGDAIFQNLTSYGSVIAGGNLEVTGAGRVDGSMSMYGVTNMRAAVFMHNPSTSTFAANLGIATSPADRLYKLTSARRFKLNIADYQAGGSILDVNPRDWLDRTQVEEYADALTAEYHHEPLSQTQQSTLEPVPWRRIPGLVAEEVAAAGLAEFVTYNTEGEVDGLMYDRLWITLIPIIRDLAARLDHLETL